MRLTSSTGDVVELSIAGYQFGTMPLKTNDRWDANWLMISGAVRDADEAWTFRDPCLTTWEADDLLRFLRQPLHSVVESIDFTEPNVSLQLTASSPEAVTITFTFRGEAAPVGTPDDVRWDEGHHVDLTVPREALQHASDQWAAELYAFPPR